MNRLLFSLAVILACSGCTTMALAKNAPVRHQTSHSVMLDGRVFHVEVATTEAARAHGLMNRKAMPADHGMLFVFVDTAPRTFWMKDTLIPLDILFFNRDRKLVAMQLDAVPCKSAPCALYPSDAPAKYALELNAGTAVEIGAKQGDVMTIKGHFSKAEP